MDQEALIHGHDIIKAPALMHSQCQRAVLYLVTKGKLHFVPIAAGQRACLDPIILVLSTDHLIQKAFYLVLLQL